MASLCAVMDIRHRVLNHVVMGWIGNGRIQDYRDINTCEVRMLVYEMENEYDGQDGICSGLSSLFCVNALRYLHETPPNAARGAAIQNDSLAAIADVDPGQRAGEQFRSVLASAGLRVTGRFSTKKGWVMLGFPPPEGTVWYVSGGGHAFAQTTYQGNYYHFEPCVGLIKSNLKFQWSQEVAAAYDGLAVDLEAGLRFLPGRDWTRIEVLLAG